MLKLVMRLIPCAALPIALGASACNPGGGYGAASPPGFADHD